MANKNGNPNNKMLMGFGKKKENSMDPMCYSFDIRIFDLNIPIENFLSNS